MRHLYDFFLFELKRFLKRRNLIILLLMFALSLYFVYEGINDYKNITDRGLDFQKSESIMFSKILNYTHYSFYGFRLFFMPAASGIFFQTPGIMSELSAKIDSIVTLNIYNNCKGRSLFLRDRTSLFRFSDVILFLGSLLILFWGYDTLNKREYLKFLTSLFNHRKIFSFLVISRVIILIFSLLILFLGQLVLLKINNIELSQKDLSGIFFFFLSALIILLLFFTIGVIAGNIRSRVIGYTTIITIWFVLVLLIPGILNHFISEKAGNLVSNYKIEVDKLHIVNEFENRSVEKYGKFSRDNMELRRKVIEGYWNDDYRKIEALEEGLKKEIAENIDRYRKLAIFTPVTFYQLTGNEVSSRGYENFLEFYAYLQEMKGKFVRFYIDRVYYNDPKELVSFIKGDENVFRARSKLPKNFGAGVLINGIYILLLLAIGYLMFKRYMFNIPDKKMPELKTLEPTIYSKKSLFIVTDDQTTKNQLYNVLNGKYKGFEGKVLVNDEDIIADPSKGVKSFVYLCHAEDVPGDIKVRHFVRFMQRLVKLSKKERARFYVEADLEEIESKRFEQLPMKVRGKLFFAAAQLQRNDCYVFNDFARGMTIDFLVNMRDEFSRIKEETDASIIYLTPDYLLAKKTADITIFLDDDPFIWKLIKNSGLLDDNKTKTQTAIT